MKNKSLVALLILCLVMCFSMGVTAEEKAPFTDIDNHWAKAAIENAYGYGIIAGYPDKTFRPNNTITRGEFAVMLYKLTNLDVSKASAEAPAIPFTDVKKSYFGYEAISALYSQNIIHGISATAFAPNANITRQDMALLFANANEYCDLGLVTDKSKNIAKFDDVGDISKYAVEGLTFGHQAGLFNGDNKNRILPKKDATRAEATQVFSQTIKFMAEPPLPVFISQVEWADSKQAVDISTGTKMYYVEMGDRDGEDLLLIHGASDSSRSMSLMAPYFARDGYHVWIPDMRGHGDTATNGMARIEPGMLAADVIAFMDVVGIERTNIVGHSRGGSIVQHVTLNYPERISRLVMMSAGGIDNTPGGRDMSMYEDPFTAIPVNGPYDEDGDGKYEWDNYMDWWYYNDNPVDADFLKMAKYESSWLPLEAWHAIRGSLADPCDLNDDIPTLALYGSLDYLIPGAENMARVKKNYGDLVDQHIMYEGMGHNLQYEYPEKMYKDIKAFFDKYPAAEVEVDNTYPIGEKEAAPVKPDATFDANKYYDKDGKLIDTLATIPQGNWVDCKHYVDLKSGIKMAYIEMGDPEGDPLILLHGSTDTSRSWFSVTEKFTEAGFHLYIPDQRGHGDTDKPDMKKYDRSLFAYDISCFMDAMGIKKASLMGHSMGSMNLQAFAMDYPEKCDKIILESTRMIGTNGESADAAWSDYDLNSPANKGKSWKPDILTWDFMEWWYYNDNPVPAVFLKNMMLDCYNYPNENWTFLFPAAYQAYILANHNIDCLVLYGNTDYLMGGDSQKTVKEQMTEAYKDSTARYIYKEYTATDYINEHPGAETKGIGHNIHWEIPATVATDVINFLGKGDS